MTAKDAIDAVVSGLAAIDARLPGDDSALANPWEEVKEQLQHGLSADWSVYLDTMQQFVSGLVSGLGDDEIAELERSLKCSSASPRRHRLFGFGRTLPCRWNSRC